MKQAITIKWINFPLSNPEFQWRVFQWTVVLCFLYQYLYRCNPRADLECPCNRWDKIPTTSSREEWVLVKAGWCLCSSSQVWWWEDSILNSDKGALVVCKDKWATPVLNKVASRTWWTSRWTSSKATRDSLNNSKESQWQMLRCSSNKVAIITNHKPKSCDSVSLL